MREYHLSGRQNLSYHRESLNISVEYTHLVQSVSWSSGLLIGGGGILQLYKQIVISQIIQLDFE